MGICFISKTPLSQDDELALMAGYAAAMDASMSESNSTQDVTTAIASGFSSPPESSEPQDGPTGVGRPSVDWESQAREELNHTSLSMCVSEANCKKSRGEKSLMWCISANNYCSFNSPEPFFKELKGILAVGLWQHHQSLTFYN